MADVLYHRRGAHNWVHHQVHYILLTFWLTSDLQSAPDNSTSTELRDVPLLMVKNGITGGYTKSSKMSVRGQACAGSPFPPPPSPHGCMYFSPTLQVPSIRKLTYRGIPGPVIKLMKRLRSKADFHAIASRPFHFPTQRGACHDEEPVERRFWGWKSPHSGGPATTRPSRGGPATTRPSRRALHRGRPPAMWGNEDLR